METAHSEQLKAKQFSSPEEEIAYLRAKIREKERSANEDRERTAEQSEKVVPVPNYEEHAGDVIQDYSEESSEVLDPEYQINERTIDELALDLDPEPHDDQMDKLIAMVAEKGIKNTLSVVQKTKNEHVEDDFHRFLVQYLKAGYPIDGLKEGTPLSRALHKTLFEVVLPPEEEKNKQRSIEELISAMEQFYAGVLSRGDNQDFTVSFEIAVNHVGEEVSFYCAVPTNRRDLFKKQVSSLFPNADVREANNDYNIFNHDGVSVGSELATAKDAIFPIKTYDAFDHDPLSVILNAFSKLEREGEGAAIQVVVKPDDDQIKKKYETAIEQIEDGKSISEAIDIPHTAMGEFYREAKAFGKEFMTDFIKGGSKKKDEDDKLSNDLSSQANKAIERIHEKIETPIKRVNLRLVASANSRPRAEKILFDLESAFSQFENPGGHSFSFDTIGKRKLKTFFHNFSFRLFDSNSMVPLNLKELTTLLHFPVRDLEESRELKQTKSTTAPAPLDMPDDGILLGINKHRGHEQEVHMAPEDRLRHYYVVGQTGTGKSTLLTNMIIQDIQNGEGCCFIDPHGSDVQDILAHVPQERYEDVIYFDPAHTARPMGLNMLEYDPRYPEQKTFVVNEMLSIFNKLFNMDNAGGPMFEQYFRNATMLVLEDPESGSTLLEISRVLSDKSFREMKLERSNNPIVNQFWQEVAGKAGGEASLENIVPYITSKFDNFLSNEIMRPIIAQESSSFNFRKVMDEQKILLVNLSKGRLGDINANLLGLILVGKILMAALSRVDMPSNERNPFYLYIDEFQNVTTDSISQILSEARKYGLSLNIAHQFIAQLQDNIRDAVFGNVGSMATYRVSSEDAEVFEKQYEPVFEKRDLMNLDNYKFVTKMLVDGVPQKPFSVSAMAPTDGNPEIVDKLKELSYLKYGQPREEVEKEVIKRYQKTATNPTNDPETGDRTT